MVIAKTHIFARLSYNEDVLTMKHCMGLCIHEVIWLFVAKKTIDEHFLTNFAGGIFWTSYGDNLHWALWLHTSFSDLDLSSKSWGCKNGNIMLLDQWWTFVWWLNTIVDEITHKVHFVAAFCFDTFLNSAKWFKCEFCSDCSGGVPWIITWWTSHILNNFSDGC